MVYFIIIDRGKEFAKFFPENGLRIVKKRTKLYIYDV
jgi:hypothetical protein